MKKALIIFLAFLVLTNFHCARFNMRTADTIHWIASIPATHLQTSRGSFVRKTGTLALSEDAVLFIHKGGSFAIPYAQIHSLEFQQNAAGPLAGPAMPSFAKEEGILAGGGLTTYFVIGFFAAVLVLWLFFGEWAKNRYSVQLDIHFTSNDGNEMSTFKMTGENLARIYSLLAEKVNR